MGSHSYSTHRLVYSEAANSENVRYGKHETKKKGPSLSDLRIEVPEDILQRERKRFNHIFEKYSVQDESLVTDVVHIHTGTIVKDNGHLKSLKDQEGGVSGLGLITDLWVEDFSLLTLPQRRKIIDTLHKIQEKHQLLGKFSDFISPSNSSSHTLESPTKKQRRRSFESSSPLKADSLNTWFPKLENENSDTYLESPTKSGVTNFSFFDDQGGQLSQIVQNDQGSHNSEFSDNDQDCDENSSINESLESYDVDLVSLVAFDYCPTTTAIECAFLECGYTSEIRKDYGEHLLRNHSDQLAQLGYPFTMENSDAALIAIPDTCILRLHEQFPLEMNFPLEPLRCGNNLKDGPCKKLFLNQEELLAHQAEPNKCSTKRQVLKCPVLGCEYITEESYDMITLHTKTHRYVGLTRRLSSLKAKTPSLSFPGDLTSYLKNPKMGIIKMTRGELDLEQDFVSRETDSQEEIDSHEDSQDDCNLQGNSKLQEKSNPQEGSDLQEKLDSLQNLQNSDQQKVTDNPDKFNQSEESEFSDESDGYSTDKSYYRKFAGSSVVRAFGMSDFKDNLQSLDELFSD